MAEACFASLTPRIDPHHSTHFACTSSRAPPLNARSLGCPLSARLFLSSAHRSNDTPARAAGLDKKKKKRKVEGDPWESFFQQLEKDLEDDTDNSNEEDITEEDVVNFEKELDTLLEDIENISTNDSLTTDFPGSIKAGGKEHIQDNGDRGFVDEKMLTVFIQNSEENNRKGLAEAGEGSGDDEKTEFELADDADGDFSDDDIEEPRIVNLEKWQVRKLAAAAELGRRKVHIKSLAAELKLKRDDVLYFLKSPPSELLMSVNELEDSTYKNGESNSNLEVVADVEMTNNDSLDDSDLETATATKPTYGPRDWYKQRRIKKVNLLTLQRVFRRTKWPTNSMIESVVKATHLPRARIVQWFEEERSKEGIQSTPAQSPTSKKLWKKPVAHSFDRL